MGKLALSSIAGVNMKKKILWQFLKKLNTDIQYGPGTPLPGICPGEIKNICSHKNLYMSVILSYHYS